MCNGASDVSGSNSEAVVLGGTDSHCPLWYLYYQLWYSWWQGLLGCLNEQFVRNWLLKTGTGVSLVCVWIVTGFARYDHNI